MIEGGNAAEILKYEAINGRMKAREGAASTNIQARDPLEKS